MKENILTLFTSEDKNDIKQAVKNIIIEQINADMTELRYSYIIDDNDLSEMVVGLLEELKAEIKVEYKEKLRAKFEAQLAGM